MKYFFCLIALLLSFTFVYAQKKSSDYSYIITAKKVILKNEKSGTDDSCVYFVPIVSDKYPELKRALSDTNLFGGETIDTVVKRYKSEGLGNTYFSYEITYADKNIISLQLYYETMGGDHPDESQRWLTLNIPTGKIYSITNEINPAGLKWIFDNYKSALNARIAEAKKGDMKPDENGSLSEEDERMYSDLEQSVNNLELEELIKNYVFTNEGIIFTTEDILPYVVHGREPDRNWYIPYKKL